MKNHNPNITCEHLKNIYVMSYKLSSLFADDTRNVDLLSLDNVNGKYIVKSMVDFNIEIN